MRSTMELPILALSKGVPAAMVSVVSTREALTLCALGSDDEPKAATTSVRVVTTSKTDMFQWK